MKKAAFISLFVAFITTFLTSCSEYKLGAQKPSSLKGINTLHIPVAVNKTQFPRAGATTTNTVTDAILGKGAYHLANSENADATLKLELETIDFRQSISDRSDSLRSEELEMRVTVNWRVIGPKGELIISKRKATGRSQIFIEDNQQVARAYALPDALEEAAEKIALQLSFSF